MSFQISSVAFSNGDTIPKKFTCDGPDVPPQLSWKEAPAATQSFALIMYDPDAPAGTFVHWVLYDLPGNTRELPEGMEKQEQLATGALQGRNDFRKIGYGGPCPVVREYSIWAWKSMDRFHLTRVRVASRDRGR